MNGPSDLPSLDEVDPELLVSDDVLDSMSEEELAAYIAVLRADAGEWRLQPVQQRAQELSKEVDELFFGGAMGGGKGLPGSSVVVTPFGMLPVRDVNVGDQINNPDGSISRVIAVYDRGIQPCWRVVFSDGAETVCDNDHLWLARVSGKVMKRDLTYRVMTTPQLAKITEKAKEAEHPLWAQIPLTEPVKFTITSRNAEARWPLEPYILGLLLGDGSIGTGSAHNVRFTTADPELVDAMTDWANRNDLRFVHDDGYNYRLAGNRSPGPMKSRFRLMLEEIGIFGHRAHDKAVPERYKVCPLEMRRALVQGLMDTDGTVDERGHASFSSSSKQLAHDVQWLTRSLGHKARITEKATGYKDPDGSRHECRTAYTVTISGRNAVDLFRLARKRERCRDVPNSHHRRVVSVERTTDEHTYCFKVDHPNGLFIAGDDFVVTHNTEFMLYHAYHECINHPGLRVLALRRTYPQLRESLIERSLMRFDPKIAKYLAHDRRWRFDNGSEIKFGFCDAEDDYRHYLSTEYDLLLWEELTEFTEKQYRMICTRNRTSTSKQKRGIRPHIIAASNPGQIGASWVRAYFIHPTDYGKQTYEQEVIVGKKVFKRKIGFVPSKATDNKYLSEDYQANLGQLGEHFRRMYLDGDWDALEGSFFADFSRANNVIEPFLIPQSWPRVRGIDYGMAKPYACIWVAFDQDGNAYVYREDYQTNLTATQQGKRVVEMSRYPDSEEVYGKAARKPEEFDRTVADPSVFNRTGAGMSIAAMYHKSGLIVAKGMNARLDGWSRLKDYVRGEDHPKLYVFESCQNLINEMTSAVYDDVRQEDLDTHGEDHACLVAGTLVSTTTGPKPIEFVTPGDLVWTRGGYSPVVEAGLTDPMADLLEVVMSNRSRLVGTANHPVWVVERGWVKLGDLKAEDSAGAVDVVDVVPVCVLRVSAAGVGPVYNLRVSGSHHEYLANGILVSNCDALRYALMARNRAAGKSKKSIDPRSPGALLDAALKRRRESSREHGMLGRW